MAWEPTELRSLPRAGLAVSALGLGTTAIGGLFEATSDAAAHATFAAAAAAGLRYVDTAPQYGHGLAEQRVGEALRALDRDRFVLSTKVGKLLVPRREGQEAGGLFAGALPFDVEFDYSREGVVRSFEESLQRLGLDRIDLLLIHDVNRKYHGERVDERFREAMAGAYPALAELRRAGTIRAIGVALNELDICERFVREGEFDAVMLPRRYTLLDQGALAGLLPLCVERGVGVLIAAPFDSGILATGSSGGGRYNYQDAPPDVLARTGAIEEACARHGVALAAAALQFPLAHPAVASVVVGMRSPAEVEANLALVRAPVPGAFWRDLKRAGLLPDAAPVPAG
jgi:D-threo-aldose 1-dehydrogenase